MKDELNIRLRKVEPDDLPLLYVWENDEQAWQDGAAQKFA